MADTTITLLILQTRRMHRAVIWWRPHNYYQLSGVLRIWTQFDSRDKCPELILLIAMPHMNLWFFGFFEPLANSAPRMSCVSGIISLPCVNSLVYHTENITNPTEWSINYWNTLLLLLVAIPLFHFLFYHSAFVHSVIPSLDHIFLFTLYSTVNSQSLLDAISSERPPVSTLKSPFMILYFRPFSF